MSIDLHCHSTYSDGALSPSALVERAASLGVQVLALTDHDTTAGLDEARSRAAELGLELLPGIEFSVSEDGGKTQLHMLGYGFSADQDELQSTIEQLRRARIDRAQRCIGLLADLGIRLELAPILDQANRVDQARRPGETRPGSIGRPHIAQALVEAGACSSHADAFTRFLRRGRPGFVPSPGVSAGRAIALIHRAGGVASLAHPFLSAGVDLAGGIEKFVGRLVSQGLDALEAHHPKHKKAQRQRLIQLANRYGLLVTGGSDFHGTPNQETPLGSVGIQPERYEKLRARLSSG